MGPHFIRERTKESVLERVTSESMEVNITDRYVIFCALAVFYGELQMKLAHEVTISKPLQDVWDYSNNPDNLTKWLNDFLRYEQITGDVKAPKVGDKSNHTYQQGKGEFTMEETITAYDPPRHIKLFMTSSYFDMEIVNEFEELEPNKTRLFAAADFVRVGLMMKIIFFFSSKKKMQADHERQINKLKSLIEAQD